MTSIAPAEQPAAQDYGLVAKFSAEAFGTFLLVFFGVGVALFANPQSAPIPTPLAFGLAVVVGALALGHISGGHFNPAVTLAVATAGRLRWKLVPGYVVAQLVGGILAAVVLWSLLRTIPDMNSVDAVFGKLSNGVDDLSPSSFPLVAGLLAEIIATAAFTAIILAATSKRAPKGTAPFAIGLGLAVLLQVIGPITNGSINPVRSTSTALFAGGESMGQLWLFWAAPLLGAAIVGLLFRGFGSDEDILTPETSGTETELDTALADAEPAEALAAPVPASGAATVSAEDAKAGAEEARDFFDGKK